MVNIPSEACEPFAAMVIGRLFARVEAAKAEHGARSHQHHDAYNRLWLAMDSLSALSTCIQTATHFSIAMNGHIIGTACMIQDELGIDPMREPGWKW